MQTSANTNNETSTNHDPDDFRTYDPANYWQIIANKAVDFASMALFPNRYGTIEIDRALVLYDNNPVAKVALIRAAIVAAIGDAGYTILATADGTDYRSCAWVIDGLSSEDEETVMGLVGDAFTSVTAGVK